MQFAPRQRKPTLEERLAGWAIGLMGGSIVMVAALVTFAFTISARSAWAALAIACVSVYAAQFYFLSSIGKYEPRRRLHVWQLSLLGHILLFGVVLWAVGNPSLALVVLLPETASFAIHLLGIHHVHKALQAA
jgi:hypothetical protein